MVVVLFAVGVTLWFGRRMAQPMRGLAVAAYQIRTLKLDPPPHVNRSRLIELHDATVAFNSMTTGLKWFETYIPLRPTFPRHWFINFSATKAPHAD